MYVSFTMPGGKGASTMSFNADELVPTLPWHSHDDFRGRWYSRHVADWDAGICVRPPSVLSNSRCPQVVVDAQQQKQQEKQQVRTSRVAGPGGSARLIAPSFCTFVWTSTKAWASD